LLANPFFNDRNRISLVSVKTALPNAVLRRFVLLSCPIFFILYPLSKTSYTAIDIVYLWVNGNDGEWRAKRQKYAQKLEATGNLGFAKFGNVEGRYRDNDELRFS